MRPEARRFEAMGTVCAVFGVGVGRDALEQGEEWARAMAARLTRFQEDSELARLNASAGRWIDVSLELESVLRASLAAYEMSGGLVNVAVLPWMHAIGYVRPLADGPRAPTLDGARPLRGLEEVLEVRPGMARLRLGSALDLGGIAKGWMADRLAESLGDNVLVNLGGDLRAIGAGPSGNGWPVDVGGATLLLRDHGAATSSTRKRRWDGAHHLIDPRTGSPSRSGLDEVSVVAESAVYAEIAAKTALLLGPAGAPSYCAAQALAWWMGESRDD